MSDQRIGPGSTILTTKRLILRNWKESDAEPFSCITTDPDVMKYIGLGKLWDLPAAKEVVERRIRQRTERGYCLWAVELIETGELIGHCGIQPLGDTGETEIGWMLAKRYWGQGLATEAAIAALNYSMNDLKFSRIVAITHAENRASSRIMEKIGMSYEKTIEWKGVEGVLFYSIVR